MANINLNNIASSFQKTESIFYELDKIAQYNPAIPLEYIKPAVYNPYNEFDGENNDEIVKELADNIAIVGLLEDLVLNKISETEYRIIAGERRFKALKTLEWKTAPAKIYSNLDPIQEQLKLHSANLQTRDYTSAQKFKFYKDVVKLLEQFNEQKKLKGTIQQAAARMLNITERQVRKYKRISELPEEIQTAVEKNEISLNSAYQRAVSPNETKKKSPEEKEIITPVPSHNNNTVVNTAVKEVYKTENPYTNNYNGNDNIPSNSYDEVVTLEDQLDISITRLERIQEVISSLSEHKQNIIAELLSKLLEVTEEL